MAEGQANHYNWLIFLVNLQLREGPQDEYLYYNWLIFLVNLQLATMAEGQSNHYNWLIFLVNLQLWNCIQQTELIITD